MDSEIILSGDLPAATINRRVGAGELVRLARGVYTDATSEAPERVVRRNVTELAGRLFDRAVITDRSGPSAGPVDGILYLAYPGRERVVDLPGVTIAARTGAAPQKDDIALPGGVALASKARWMAENVMPSRTSARLGRRRLTTDELANWIDITIQIEGADRMRQTRARADELAASLGVSDEDIIRFDRLVGVALNTTTVRNAPRVLTARGAGQPFDPRRVGRFDTLAAALRHAQPQSRPANHGESRPFFEAYFSNYIEGTTFTIDEALEIVYDNVEPRGRPADAHDITSTFAITNDRTEMARRPASTKEFLDLLRERHARIMSARPEIAPGEWKTIPNQAGGTVFADPALVVGTLTEGFARIDALDSPWERALMSGYVVSEVHPFADGNGRISRLMMNSELEGGGESRIIIPTVFRDDYIGGLRQLSRNDEAGVYVKAMRIGQDWTNAVDFSDLNSAIEELRSLNAFVDDGSARLLMPARFAGAPSTEFDEQARVSRRRR